MKPFKQFASFTTSFLTLLSCQNNNDKIDLNFEKEFQDLIKKNNAVFFNYPYDGLTLQKSHFVNSKLRFLKFHFVPELGSVDTRVYFEEKTDSISKCVLKNIEPEN